MWWLTLATNASSPGPSSTNGLAVTALRRAGQDIDDAVLAHIWPHHENIHFYGTHSVDIDGEPAKLGSDGYRLLRAPGRRDRNDEPHPVDRYDQAAAPRLLEREPGLPATSGTFAAARVSGRT
jgi:hypothetical protein